MTTIDVVLDDYTFKLLEEMALAEGIAVEEVASRLLTRAVNDELIRQEKQASRQ